MKPTSEMNDREAACFTNLKKSMNESYLLLDYLKQAQTLAPNSDVDAAISTCIRMMNDTMIDIQHAIRDLTN